MKAKCGRIFLQILALILVALFASGTTLYFCITLNPETKLEQLEKLISRYFVGEADQTALTDAAAQAMIGATGDRWSYYIPASQYEKHMEQMQNAYVGIGLTIVKNADQEGVEITKVEPSGGAFEAGIQAGDRLIAVEQQKIDEIGIDKASEIIRGEEGTAVSLTILRGEQTLELAVMRKKIMIIVAESEMLEGQIGLIHIENFDERCAEETISHIEKMVGQGAKALIFDVRNNPGGYKKELVQVLDYLLPEGIIFCSETHDGKQTFDHSDEKALDLPFAVLVNGESYSAAEFFAAALNEYDKAVIVGEPTVGKSYFQNTFVLRDGSAVGLSIGKYRTPKGVSLAEEGGLKPEIEVKLDKQTAAKLTAGILLPQEDPQIQAAIDALS